MNVHYLPQPQPLGHTTSIYCGGEGLSRGLFRPQCEDCDWRSGFVRSLARAQDITREHHDKTAGVWGPWR